jgi:hypothetical protein|tara:strand:- start:6618 stop:7352 length:735 start_codon:yes stop_codon:yes gene_type:complete
MIHKEYSKVYKLDLPPLDPIIKTKIKMWANLWALDKPLTFEEHTAADKCIADSLGAKPKSQEEYNKSVGDIGRRVDQAFRKTNYINNFNNGLVNCVAHNFDPYDELASELDAYSEIFSEPVVPIVGVMRNPTDKLASFPPHYDKVKAASINIVIELGGSNVRTVLYEDARTENFEDPFIKKISDCVPIASYKLPKEEWHLFNTQRLHSVENIETRRVTVSLMPESAPTIEQFFNKYNYLIKEAL